MNNKKIEKGAILKLKSMIYEHDLIDEQLQECDKEESWDGDILLYRKNEFKVENIEYKIQVQVKGKNDNSLLRRQAITYPVEYRQLRNYVNHGGVCYFVIVIADDKQSFRIFYSGLTPIKLKALLKNTERKKPKSKKSISLRPIFNSESLYNELKQFAYESREQGSGELVRKAISFDDMVKIDSLRVTGYINDREELYSRVKNGDIAIFGHFRDLDIWIPFEYDFQKSVKIIPKMMVEKSFGVGDTCFYERYVLAGNFDSGFCIELSDNLTIDLKHEKFNFEVKSDIEGVMRDINFLDAVCQEHKLVSGEDIICEYSFFSFNSDMKQMISDVKDFYEALKQFDFRITKSFSEFTNADFFAMNTLIRLYRGEYHSKNTIEWYMWWWDDRVMPIFVVINPNDHKVHAESGLRFSHFKLTVGMDAEYEISPLFMYKREILEKLYDVEESVLLEEIQKTVVNSETEGHMFFLFLESLSVYDKTYMEKFYNISKFLVDRVLEFSPDSPYWKLNQLQIIKRKSEFSKEMYVWLEKLIETAEDKKLVCGAEILLENKRNAYKCLNEMTLEERTEFEKYPIYNLLK